ncbi:MAG: PilZ domain-containing protein [Desulfobacterales bacterium]|nr:PilZ domain-containing protein [Desulfobacterales bacterium]
MAKYTRRIFIRRYLEAPIEIRGNEQDEGRLAMAFDCCKEGMHFVSDDYIGPGTIIFIRLCDGLSPNLGDGCDTSLRARVVWCRRCTRENKQGFSIGVHFSPDDQNGLRREQ